MVDKLITLENQFVKLGDQQTNARRDLEEEIARTDREIDELVYKIYGITEDEKKIIEASFERQ